jgi:hypothetical protein
MSESRYELKTYVRGAWRMQRVFDDRERAVAEAMRLTNDPRTLGVKVVRESFDERQGAFVTRTIFRRSKTDQVRAELFAAEIKIRGILSGRRARRAI